MKHEDRARGEGRPFHWPESVRGNRVAASVVDCNAAGCLVCLCVMLRIIALWIRSEPKEEMMKWDNHVCDMYYWLWCTCMKYELKTVEVQ